MANEKNLSTLTKFECYTLSKQFVYEDWMSENQVSFDSLISSLNYLDEIYSVPSTAASRMVQDGIIPVEVEDYANRINTVYSYVVSQGKLELEVSPTEFNSLISQIENDIIADGIEYDTANYTGDWNACMMMTCSVAKASYLYWYTAANNPNHPWNFAVNGDPAKGPIWNKIKEIAGKLRDDVIISYFSYDISRDNGMGVFPSLGNALGGCFSSSGLK